MSTETSPITMNSTENTMLSDPQTTLFAGVNTDYMADFTADYTADFSQFFKEQLFDDQTLQASNFQDATALSSPLTWSPVSVEDVLPTSLLQDNLLQELFVTAGFETASTEQEFGSIQEQPSTVTSLPSPPPATTVPESVQESTKEPASQSVPSETVSPKRKHQRKPLPHGQSTLPIKVTTHKSCRPQRKLECFNCKVTKTPLWRRTPDRAHTLCNACGLYYKQYDHHRPLHVRHKSHQTSQMRMHPYASEHVLAPVLKSESTSPQQASQAPAHTQSASVAPMMSMFATLPLLQPQQQPQQENSSLDYNMHGASSGIECANCHQTQTPLWRKNDRGQSVCNACGLYARLHHRDRPIEMRKAKIQRRRRDWSSEDEGSPIEEWLATDDKMDTSDFELSSCTERASSPETTSSVEHSPSTPPNTLDIEDSRFLSLLSQMNKDQMQGFLGMLERRCDILRVVLGSEDNKVASPPS